MANWKLWPVDRMVGRITASTQILCNLNNALAPRMVDGRQRTVWVSGSTTAPKISMLMDNQYTVGAIAFGNIRNASGEGIVLSHGATIGAETNAVATITAPDLDDWLYETGQSSASGPGWVARFSSTVSVALSIGTVSLLDKDEMIEFSGGESPDFPIGQSMTSGYTPVQLAGGDTIRQIITGSTRKWVLNFGALLSGSGETYRKIQSSLQRFNGWANGVWLTTDEYNASTDRRAYYCVPAPVDIGMGIAQAGPWGEMILELHEMPKGPR